MYQCSICLEQYNNDSHLAATRCGHIFHEACITEWCHTEERRPCPICRGLCTPTHTIHLETDPEYENKLERNEELIIQLTDKLDELRIQVNSMKRLQEENEKMKLELEAQKQVLAALKIEKNKQIEDYKNIIEDIHSPKNIELKLTRIENMLKSLTSTGKTNNSSPNMKTANKCVIRNVLFEDITTSITDFIFQMCSVTGLAISGDDIEDAEISQVEDDKTIEVFVVFTNSQILRSFLNNNFTKYPQFENIQVEEVI